MTTPAIIHRFVVAFFVVSGVCWWIFVAFTRPTWDVVEGLVWVTLTVLAWIGPDIIRAVGRR